MRLFGPAEGRGDLDRLLGNCICSKNDLLRAPYHWDVREMTTASTNLAMTTNESNTC